MSYEDLPCVEHHQEDAGEHRDEDLQYSKYFDRGDGQMVFHLEYDPPIWGRQVLHVPLPTPLPL